MVVNMKTKIYLVLFIGIIFCANGCAMIPKYKQPELPIPDTFPKGEAYVGGQPGPGAQPVADLRWQNIFSDEKLKKVIELSLINNRDLMLAALNVERSRALYGVQRAELFPAITATGAGSKTHVPADLSLTGAKSTSEQYSVDFGIASWEVDLFGRLRSLKARALQEYLATEQVQRGTKTALISGVAQAYFSLAADLENLKLARYTFESQQNAHKMVQQQYDNGIAVEADLQRSQILVDTAKRDISIYTQSVAQGRNALDLIVGSAVPEYLLPADLTSLSPVKDISLGLSSEVLLRRPDIMAAEHELKAAYALIGVARAAFFPKISLTTLFGTASNELSNLFGPQAKAWSIASSAAMPLFDARILSAYKVSTATFKIFVVKYEKAIQTAFSEVSDVLAVRGTVDQQVATQEAIVKSSQIIYQLSEQRYNQGIDSYLSVLDAQRSLYTAQKAFTLLRLSKLVNQVKLYAVLGGDGDGRRK